MGSISKVLLRGTSLRLSLSNGMLLSRSSCFSFPIEKLRLLKFRKFSSKASFPSLESPDVSRLAKTAHISLTPTEVEEFGPKIQQVVDWFGQLQGVDLQKIEPSVRADTDNNLRDNVPETFENMESMIASVPNYEEPYIKVPRVLNMD